MPLNHNSGGSLDIYIQANSPGKDKESNWVPAPANGDFNIVIRNYWPKKEALDGAYKNPPIRKVRARWIMGPGGLENRNISAQRGSGPPRDP
jgi:hypothetical protein